MNVVQGQTALCHAVSCHRAVDAAGQHIQGAAAGAHGQTRSSGTILLLLRWKKYYFCSAAQRMGSILPVSKDSLQR